MAPRKAAACRGKSPNARVSSSRENRNVATLLKRIFGDALAALILACCWARLVLLSLRVLPTFVSMTAPTLPHALYRPMISALYDALTPLRRRLHPPPKMISEGYCEGASHAKVCVEFVMLQILIL